MISNFQFGDVQYNFIRFGYNRPVLKNYSNSKFMMGNYPNCIKLACVTLPTYNEFLVSLSTISDVQFMKHLMNYPVSISMTMNIQLVEIKVDDDKLLHFNLNWATATRPFTFSLNCNMRVAGNVFMAVDDGGR